MKKIISIFLIIILFVPSVIVSAESVPVNISKYLNSLDKIVQTAMDKSGTPGASVAVVSGDNTLIRTYGYADKAFEKLVSDETLFELGSMSKAFTGLGILYLEQEGKLKLTDDVRRYIPWLTLNYTGEYKGQKINGDVPVTIGNVLYQTAGIPFKTIGYG